MFGKLFKSVGSALGVAPEAPVFEVPATLPKIQAANAAELVAKAGLDVPPGAPNPATQTPAQFLGEKLNKEQDMLGATKAIAHGLPEKDGLKWATDSAKLVEAKLPPEQKEALAAAEAFNANPSLATREAAAAAADKAGMLGPGGLAAKAASVAQAPNAPVVEGGSKVLPSLVTGAVVLAASLSPKGAKPIVEKPAEPKLALPEIEIPKTPAAPLKAVTPPPGSEDAIKTANTFKPFIERGLQLAAG